MIVQDEYKANLLRWLVSNELHCLVSKALLLRPLTRLGLAVRCALAHLDAAANLFCEMDLAMTPSDDGLDWLGLQQFFVSEPGVHWMRQDDSAYDQKVATQSVATTHCS